MWHVDIIRSVTFPIQEYVGRDLEQRLADHNDGKSTHTAKYKPWRLVPGGLVLGGLVLGGLVLAPFPTRNFN
jgi:hypothetical protein